MCEKDSQRKTKIHTHTQGQREKERESMRRGQKDRERDGLTPYKHSCSTGQLSVTVTHLAVSSKGDKTSDSSQL